MVVNPDFTSPVVEALRRRGRTTVRIRGRSMYPTLHNGAQVVLEPVVYDELRPGDLLVFHNGREIICHRLIRKASRLCYCKGDTNLWADPPVVWFQVLGRVTHVVDNALCIRPLDLPPQRRRATLLARFSYLYALYFHLLHGVGRCRWWTRGIEWSE